MLLICYFQLRIFVNKILLVVKIFVFYLMEMKSVFVEMDMFYNRMEKYVKVVGVLVNFKVQGVNIIFCIFEYC